MQVRRSLADFIIAVLDDSNNPLNAKYTEILDLFLLDSREELIARILTPDEHAGWGGNDLGPFVADAFKISFIIRDAVSALDHEYKPSMVNSARSLQTVYLWFNDDHYQILREKNNRKSD